MAATTSTSASKNLNAATGPVPSHGRGGKIVRRRQRRIINRAAQALRMAAHSLYRSKCALGAYYRSLKGRLGPAKAIKATAHRIAQLVYRALRYGGNYVDIGQQEFERRRPAFG